MKLSNIEKNVLLVALDHMEEETRDLIQHHKLQGDMWREEGSNFLNACESIRTKINQL